MENFELDFISQVSSGNLYELLIPSKDNGILIFKIFEQLKHRSSEIFTESDLKQIISNHKKYEKKEQHEDIKDIIRDLNEFFLKSTEDGYRLTEYAKIFSEIIKKKLDTDIKPSDIERRLIYLKKSLIRDENQFCKWYEIEFINQKIELEMQLEGLERKVINTIKQFRNEILNDDLIGLNLVKSVLTSVVELKNQTQELKGALKYAEEIKQIVNNVDFNIDSDSERIIAYKQSINTFFSIIFSDLERITKRIDRVTPKLRQFYYNMTSLDFERNTRRFLNFLLEKTVVIGSKPNWRLEFPSVEGVNFNKGVLKLVQSFYYVDNQRNLYQGSKIVVHKPNSNQETQNVQKSFAQNKIETRDMINNFLSEIKKELELEGIVNCEPHFIKILEKTKNINIIVKIAHLLINEYMKNIRYQLKICSPDIIKHNNLIISKIIITKL